MRHAWTPTTSLSEPRCAQGVSVHTTTLVKQCSADLMSRSCVLKTLLNRFPELLHAAHLDTDVNTMWQHIAHSLHTAAAEKDLYRRQQKSTWLDEKYRQAQIEKNDAYQAILKSAENRAVCEKYHEKRREERCLFRRKKHEFVKAESEKIEMHGSRNDAGKFFQKIKRMSAGFKTGASFCKDQDANLMTDIKSSLAGAFQCHT